MHDRLMVYQTLRLLCGQVLSRYTDNELVLSEYVKQNTALFWGDSLIQKWVQLLKVDVDFERDQSTGNGQTVELKESDDVEMKLSE